jgi:hypothetical protein
MKKTRQPLAVGLCIAALCVAVIAAIAGCSGPRGTTTASSPALAADQLRSEATAPGDALQAQKSSGQPASTGALANLPQERMVIKSAALVVRVHDVSSTFVRAIQLAETNGGYIQSSTQSQEEGDRADITIRVPPHGFLPLIASLEALGTPSSKTISGEDVTQEYYDLSAELENQVEVRGRLFQLLKQAAKVTDAIAVEEQLERIGANVNRIKGRMKYLETMTGMSTISLSLYSDARPATEGFVSWASIGHGFFRAAQILVDVLFVILQCLVVAIPLAAISGAATLGIRRVVRRVQVRRKAGSKTGARK